MKYLNSAAVAQSWRALHVSLVKIGLRHRYFLKNFTKCRTAILKNESRSLLLGTTLFWKYIYFRNFRLHIFYISYFDVMIKRNEFLRKSFIQKQYFS